MVVFGWLHRKLHRMSVGPAYNAPTTRRKCTKAKKKSQARQGMTFESRSGRKSKLFAEYEISRSGIDTRALFQFDFDVVAYVAVKFR
jgi:hypothetical protein